MRPLSKTMRAALDKLQEYGVFVRWEGGYWTPEARRSPFAAPITVDIGAPDKPGWWVGFGTVQALVSRGLAHWSGENCIRISRAGEEFK